MSKAVEVSIVDGKFKLVPTEKEMEDVAPTTQAAIDTLDEHRPDAARDRRRRDLFVQWMTDNPNDADRVLDDLNRYGVVFEHEYFTEEKDV